MKILLVIPAFNEEPTLPGLIQSAKQHLRDIMVIDDGSEDATSLASMMNGAMVHRLKDNMGKGEALKVAFEYALNTGYDYVMTIDGDGQHDPNDIPNFLPLLGHYDLILGNRMSDAGRVPFIRRIANFSSSLVVSILCGRRIHDSQTGFRVYSRKLLETIPLSSSHYDMETEVIVKAARRGLRIGHARIQTIYAGEVSRFNKVTDSARFVWVIFKSFLWW